MPSLLLPTFSYSAFNLSSKGQMSSFVITICKFLFQPTIADPRGNVISAVSDEVCFYPALPKAQIEEIQFFPALTSLFTFQVSALTTELLSGIFLSLCVPIHYLCKVEQGKKLTPGCPTALGQGMQGSIFLLSTSPLTGGPLC